MLAPWKKSYGKPRQHIKKQRHHFADKGPYSQSYGFSNSHIEMWELYYKEGWVPKNWWCFWTVVVLEKALESPLDWEEIKPVNPKGNQPWIFTRRNDAEAETSVFWLTHWERPWCWERLNAEAWCVAVRVVAKSWTQLSNWTTAATKSSLCQDWFCYKHDVEGWDTQRVSSLIKHA